MGYVFEPESLHEVSRLGIGLDPEPMCDAVVAELKRRYPEHISTERNWLFNDAGGAMGMMRLLHASLTEYVIIFGTPIGTEGHSGRYAAEVYDFMMAGEMWTYLEGDMRRTVHVPGDAAHLDRDRIKGYRVPDFAWMLEYGRGRIPTMLPFGLADSVLSTLDFQTVARTVGLYARLTVGQLLKGKI